MKRRHGCIGGMVVALIVFLGAAYLAGGVLIYNTLTPVQAKCTSPSMVHYQENTPVNFRAIYHGVVTDATPWWMAAYEAVRFPARDEPDITIAGWYVPAMGAADPAQQPVVIVVHGLRACKRDATALLPAGMLAHNGFNVLLMDLRNHGDSTVQDGRTSAGNREYRDVLGAWDWLQSEKDFAPESIGIQGESLGAGTTAIAFGEELRIAAVWLDSPYADMAEVVSAELARNGFPPVLASSAPLASQAVAGFNIFEKSPLLAMDKVNGRPIFIVHGTADTRLSADFSHDLIARIASHGWTVESWFPEGLDHVQTAYAYPDEYAAKLAAFFGKALKKAT